MHVGPRRRRSGRLEAPSAAAAVGRVRGRQDVRLKSLDVGADGHRSRGNPAAAAADGAARRAPADGRRRVAVRAVGGGPIRRRIAPLRGVVVAGVRVLVGRRRRCRRRPRRGGGRGAGELPRVVERGRLAAVNDAVKLIRGRHPLLLLLLMVMVVLTQV